METLKVVLDDKGKSLSVRLIGSIDEECALDAIKMGNTKDVEIDMADVKFINSYGGREWIKWTHNINTKKNIKLLNCPSIFLEYVNMIEGFIPSNGSIESFKVPYYCENCNLVTTKTYESKNTKDIGKDIALTTGCSNCKSPAEIDVIVPNFFKFLK
jgi:hypothetical protein